MSCRYMEELNLRLGVFTDQAAARATVRVYCLLINLGGRDTEGPAVASKHLDMLLAQLDSEVNCPSHCSTSQGDMVPEGTADRLTLLTLSLVLIETEAQLDALAPLILAATNPTRCAHIQARTLSGRTSGSASCPPGMLECTDVKCPAKWSRRRRRSGTCSTL